MIFSLASKIWITCQHLGVDGFTAKNFKHSWDLVKTDLVAAIHEFSDKGRRYKAFNYTIVSFIPKSNSANSIKEYKPISVCPTFYKIIAIIMTKRLGHVICSIISPNQAAFITGQQIHNHILLAYELIKGYSINRGPPRCMVQIDRQKAYDMLSWRALQYSMQELGIPPIIIDWIMLGVSTVSYRFQVNGTLSQMLQVRRGIRQGYPLSPYLFTTIMEYLQRCLHQMQCNPDFNLHSKLKQLV